MAAAEAPTTLAQHLERAATQNPAQVMLELDRGRAEESLSDFGALAWHVLEPPSRPLIRDYAWWAICEHLEAIHRGEIHQLVINVPPGFSKSLLLNVFFPAWEWGPRNRPDLRYNCYSYAQDLTIRDNRKCRNVIQSDLYQGLWGDRFFLVSDQNAKVRFDTNRAGFKIATSIGGVTMGERADRNNVDDPNNVKTVESDTQRNDALYWFAEVLPTRVNDPGRSATIVIQQRTHQKDVTGLILEKELGYTWLCLPMEYEGRRCFTEIRRPKTRPRKVQRVKTPDDPLPSWVDAGKVPKDATSVGPVRSLYNWEPRKRKLQLLSPRRVPEKYLEEDLKPSLRSMGGTYAESGQLQQRPVPRGGGMFQRGDFQIVTMADIPAGLFPARGYDLAASEEATASWSAGVKIAIRLPAVYILDADRIHGTPGKVETWMKALAAADGKRCEIDFPQDPGQAGKWQKGHLGGVLAGYNVHSSPESGSKEDRARPLASQSELGNLYLLEGPWNDTFIAEACLFPRGDFKDLIDAASRAYARALKLLSRTATVPSAPKTIGG